MKPIVGNSQVILFLSSLCFFFSPFFSKVMFTTTAHDSQNATDKVVCVCERSEVGSLSHFVCQKYKWETGF